MSPLRGRRVRVLASAILIAVVAACNSGPASGGSAPSPSTPALEIPPGPSLPACANAGPSVVPPVDFPVTFPFPPGSVITAADVPPGGGTRVQFVVPLDVPAFGVFLEKQLPAAGLSIGGGEAEADELESKFSGQGLDGQVTAREISGCPGVLSVQVVIRAT